MYNTFALSPMYSDRFGCLFVGNIEGKVLSTQKPIRVTVEISYSKYDNGSQETVVHKIDLFIYNYCRLEF